MTYLRLLALFIKIGVLNELEYRVNFFVQVFQSSITLLSAILGLSVVFLHTNTLGGWKPNDLLALLGIHILVGGMIGLVIQPSMERFMTEVRQGTLDFTLTKPEDAQILVSVKQIAIWRLFDVFLGIGVLIYAVVQIGSEIGYLQAISFLIVMLSGGAIVYAFWLVLATLTFWFVKVDNILVIFQSMYTAGRWPIGIYPPWLRLTLTFLVPVAFATTVPAEAISGRLTLETLVGSIALAAAMLVGSRLFWLFGLRHYSGASA